MQCLPWSLCEQVEWSLLTFQQPHGSDVSKDCNHSMTPLIQVFEQHAVNMIQAAVLVEVQHVLVPAFHAFKILYLGQDNVCRHYPMPKSMHTGRMLAVCYKV